MISEKKKNWHESVGYSSNSIRKSFSNSATARGYVVSSGIESMMKGSKIGSSFTDIFGGRLYEKDGIIAGIKSSITFTEKTKFIFAINKGITSQIRENPYNVNTFVENEKKIILAQVEESGKKPEVAEKMIEGKLNKRLEEVCLLNQIYIRDSKLKIEDLQNEIVSKLGENIKISRFVRYQIGETQTDG